MKRRAHLERLRSAGKVSVNEQRLFFNLTQPLPFTTPTVVHPLQPLPSHCNTIMDDQIPTGVAPPSTPPPALHTPHPDLPPLHSSLLPLPFLLSRKCSSPMAFSRKSNSEVVGREVGRRSNTQVLLIFTVLRKRISTTCFAEFRSSGLYCISPP